MLLAGQVGANIVATVEPCLAPSVLASLWQELESRADTSAFLSWGWMGTQLAQFGAPALMVTTRRGDQVVGLALLGRRPRRAFDVLRAPSLHLNETGDADQDAVIMEYNAVLAERGLERQVTAATLAAIAGHDGWRELRLGGVSTEMVTNCRKLGLHLRIDAHHQAPYADFAAMPPGDLLDGLSRNSRQQIRRALRLYEERGEIAVERPASAEQALTWLDELETLHTPYWQSRGKPGAFVNRHFRPFHRRLIADGFDSGIIDILRVCAGAGLVGVLYNFRHNSWAYSYQSGFAYEADDRLKPGLVCHLLAMRRYRDEGLLGYRFLAGDSRYKNSLANAKDEMVWVTADRGDLAHGVERVLRHLRDRVYR